jgi:hypothetical protein
MAAVETKLNGIQKAAANKAAGGSGTFDKLKGQMSQMVGKR